MVGLYLERDIGNKLSKLLQPPPGIFMQESEGNVKCGTSPHLQRSRLSKNVAGGRSNLEHVVSPESGGQ